MVRILVTFSTLSDLLFNLHTKMLSVVEPMCHVAQGMAALAVLFKVSFHIYRSMSMGEPLLGAALSMVRSLLVLLCIALFPSLVIGGLNGILSPLSSGTQLMLEKNREKMEDVHEQYEMKLREKISSDDGQGYVLDDEEFNRRMQRMGILEAPEMLSMVMERSAFHLRERALRLLREILRILYDSMTLCLNTLRTFFLVILSIVGPISFAISIWKGFEITLPYWISKYVSVYLWLPLGNILSALMERIECMVIENDLAAITSGQDISQEASDAFWIAFSLMGIVGFRMVPHLSSWIIQCSTAERYSGAIAEITSSVLSAFYRK
ncbi:MAG: hypothetical protein KBS95_08165 [Alistipes sp.]|nr:hypothetical protein [Candidatus Alistipes equi]